MSVTMQQNPTVFSFFYCCVIFICFKSWMEQWAFLTQTHDRFKVNHISQSASLKPASLGSISKEKLNLAKLLALQKLWKKICLWKKNLSLKGHISSQRVSRLMSNSRVTFRSFRPKCKNLNSGSPASSSSSSGADGHKDTALERRDHHKGGSAFMFVYTCLHSVAARSLLETLFCSSGSIFPLLI